jgi:uncharacterized protein
MRIGLYGGCFNPVHQGHLMAARGACDALGLDRLIFIPSGNPPLKGNAGLAEGAHRLAMLELAIAGDPRMSVSGIEIDRDGPSFTVDTVRALRSALPVGAELFFLLGDDCIGRLPQWKGIDELHAMLRFAILPRQGERTGSDDDRLIWPNLPRQDISSTQIRAELKMGQSLAAKWLQPDVAHYIESHSIYAAHPSLPVSDLHSRIHSVLDSIDHAIIACSGGIDSTLLAMVAHAHAPGKVTVAHAISPAVPAEATERVRALAQQEGWTLSIVQSGEFQDENYLSNPVNRCYFCKSNLYDSLSQIAAAHDSGTVLSGANLDDLGEYRPGLEAAAERGVRHPWIEANFAKADIRALARERGVPFAELPSSPCLASRLYTGTRVTASRLRAVHACETHVKKATGLAIVRCRLRGDSLIVEVPDADRAVITPALLSELGAVAANHEPGINTAELDAQAYSPGRAFVGVK